MNDAKGVPGFYATPGLTTGIRALDKAVGDLPSDVGELTRIVQRISVHMFWAKPQGYEISEAQPGIRGYDPSKRSSNGCSSETTSRPRRSAPCRTAS